VNQDDLLKQVQDLVPCGGVTLFQDPGLRIATIIFCTLTIPTNVRAPNVAALPKPQPIGVLYPSQVLTVSHEMVEPAGLAWEESPDGGWGRLWTSDVDQGTIVSLQSRPGGTRVSYTVAGHVRAGPVVFNPVSRKLWAIDRMSNQIIRGFAITGGPSNPTLVPSQRIGIGQVQLRHRPGIRGIAFDPTGAGSEADDLVWVCRGGGLCSSVELWNLKNGIVVVGRFFPKCEPIDITIDPEGRRLWILADNGPGNRTILLERKLTGTPAERVASASGMTERFIALPSTFRPSAIAASRDAVWVLTPPSGSSVGRVQGDTCVWEFRVGPPVTHPTGPESP
jgi:hypothetical protein